MLRAFQHLKSASQARGQPHARAGAGHRPNHAARRATPSGRGFGEARGVAREANRVGGGGQLGASRCAGKQTAWRERCLMEDRRGRARWRTCANAGPWILRRGRPTWVSDLAAGFRCGGASALTPAWASVGAGWSWLSSSGVAGSVVLGAQRGTSCRPSRGRDFQRGRVSQAGVAPQRGRHVPQAWRRHAADLRNTPRATSGTRTAITSAMLWIKHGRWRAAVLSSGPR